MDMATCLQLASIIRRDSQSSKGDVEMIRRLWRWLFGTKRHTPKIGHNNVRLGGLDRKLRRNK